VARRIDLRRARVKIERFGQNVLDIGEGFGSHKDAAAEQARHESSIDKVSRLGLNCYSFEIEFNKLVGERRWNSLAEFHFLSRSAPIYTFDCPKPWFAYLIEGEEVR